MRPTRGPAARGGFTLVELLVVIAIIGILAALVAAGIGKVRNGQMTAATDQTLTKLQLGLGGQYKAVVDQCRQDAQAGKIPQAVVDFCENDKERALALWAYMNLRNELPQSFAEAGGAGPLGLTRRNTFDRFTGAFTTVDPRSPAGTGAVVPAELTNPANQVPAELQAAALLYVILAEKGYKGVQFAADDATQSAQGDIGPYFRTVGVAPNFVVAPVTFRVFKDAWGTPITFARFAETAELNAPPYSPAGAATSRDPLDPKGLLSGWATAASKSAAQTAVGTTFNAANKVATVVSAGGNKNADPSDDSVRWSASNPDGLFGGDNSLGYRLMRQGNKGE